MAKDWKRLAEYAAHRRAELGLSQIEVAQRGPLSLDRVQAIEGAKGERYRLATLLALERALRWTDGSVHRILDGGEPGVVASGSATIGPAQVRMTAKGTAHFDESGPIDDLPEDPDERTAALMERYEAREKLRARLREEQRVIADEIARVTRETG